MINGQCPRCKKNTVYRRKNGIISGDKHIFVKGLGLMTPRTDKMTYLCTTCGYYENYVVDKAILGKVASKWEKV
ncbi:MAG: hypothetical protein DRG71_06115 [Deltaproteobacteria bacterium]|nr:MAG: hypothetical protein DRG71_06115 [Deltaproteobacteria bacterium]